MAKSFDTTPLGDEDEKSVLLLLPEQQQGLQQQQQQQRNLYYASDTCPCGKELICCKGHCSYFCSHCVSNGGKGGGGYYYGGGYGYNNGYGGKGGYRPPYGGYGDDDDDDDDYNKPPYGHEYPINGDDDAADDDAADDDAADADDDGGAYYPPYDGGEPPAYDDDVDDDNADYGGEKPPLTNEDEPPYTWEPPYYDVNDPNHTGNGEGGGGDGGGGHGGPIHSNSEACSTIAANGGEAPASMPREAFDLGMKVTISEGADSWDVINSIESYLQTIVAPSLSTCQSPKTSSSSEERQEQQQFSTSSLATASSSSATVDEAATVGSSATATSSSSSSTVDEAAASILKADFTVGKSTTPFCTEGESACESLIIETIVVHDSSFDNGDSGSMEQAVMNAISCADIAKLPGVEATLEPCPFVIPGGGAGVTEDGTIIGTGPGGRGDGTDDSDTDKKAPLPDAIENGNESAINDQDDRGMIAGVIIAILVACITILVLLLLFVRRSMQYRAKRRLASGQGNLDMDGLVSDDGQYLRNKIHVVGDDNSDFGSRLTGYTSVVQRNASQQELNKMGLPPSQHHGRRPLGQDGCLHPESLNNSYMNQDVHICTSATCRVCVGQRETTRRVAFLRSTLPGDESTLTNPTSASNASSSHHSSQQQQRRFINLHDSVSL
jgi:hypothetical protein